MIAPAHQSKDKSITHSQHNLTLSYTTAHKKADIDICVCLGLHTLSFLKTDFTEPPVKMYFQIKSEFTQS